MSRPQAKILLRWNSVTLGNAILAFYYFSIAITEMVIKLYCKQHRFILYSLHYGNLQKRIRERVVSCTTFKNALYEQ